MKSFQVVIVAILFMALLMTSDAYKRKSKKSELEHTFFILFYFFFYFLRQHLQYLLTIWDTYATNNTLLYSVYTYTPTFTYLYNIKRGGGGSRANFF